MRGETRASEGEGGRLSSDGRATPARHADDRRLRAREARYQALVAATAQIAWTTPPDGVVEDMPAWRAYTGQSVQEVRGLGWLDALHPDDRAGRLWDQAVASRSVCEVEYRVRRHDGAYRTSSCWACRCWTTTGASASGSHLHRRHGAQAGRGRAARR